jgi:hypothetical protein
MPYAQNVGDHAAEGGLDQTQAVIRELWSQVREQAHEHETVVCRPCGVPAVHGDGGPAGGAGR